MLFFGVFILVCVVSNSRFWVEEKWYRIAWYPWVLIVIIVMLFGVLLVLDAFYNKSYGSGIALLVAPFFFLPALWAFIIAIKYPPPREKKFFRDQNLFQDNLFRDNAGRGIFRDEPESRERRRGRNEGG